MPSQYLIYALTDPRSTQWRYIGKSQSGMSRPMEHGNMTTLFTNQNPHKCNWIRSLYKLGISYSIEVLEEFANATPLADAEREWIAAARAAGVDLLNKTDGGEGGSGVRWTPEQRHNLSKIMKQSLKVAAHLAVLNSRFDDLAFLEAHSQQRGGRRFVDETGRVFITQGQAAVFYGVSQGHVTQVLNGHRNHTKAHTFRYLEEGVQSST